MYGIWVRSEFNKLSEDFPQFEMSMEYDDHDEDIRYIGDCPEYLQIHTASVQSL